MDYLEQAKIAVERSHHCIALHKTTVPVRELFQGRVIWDGEVEIFDLTGHPKAKRCYAWGYSNEAGSIHLEFVTVLEIPPVDSPETAVKVAIAAQARKQRSQA